MRESFGSHPMSELQTLRGRRVWPRVRCVQGRLFALGATEEEGATGGVEPASPATTRAGKSTRLRPPAAAVRPPPMFQPLAFRHVVAGWPVECRERWGRRANELEAAGLPWRDAETQAFIEVWDASRHGACSYGLGSSDAERN